MKWLKKLFKKKHIHRFDPMDIINLRIDPKCSCGITLSECKKELKGTAW